MPAKVKVFCWRLLHDAIPTRLALVKRHVQVQELECLLCGVELETSIHFIKECTVAKEFWRNGPLKEVIPSVPNSSLKEWVWTVMDALDKDQQSLFFSSASICLYLLEALLQPPPLLREISVAASDPTPPPCYKELMKLAPTNDHTFLPSYTYVESLST
ncbi:hypothetical protein ACLB2K_077584 [Fragaria x ananassa]